MSAMEIFRLELLVWVMTPIKVDHNLCTISSTKNTMKTIMEMIEETKVAEKAAAEAKERAEKAAKRAAWKKVALIMRDPRFWIKARQNDKEHVSIMVSADTMRLFQHELTVLETVSLHAGEIAVYKNTASDYVITVYDPKMPEHSANQTFIDFLDVACEKAEISLEELDKEIEFNIELSLKLGTVGL